MRYLYGCALLFLFTVLITLLSSCECEKETSIKTESTNNKNYAAEYLFEKDGCKIYRFWEGWDRHYFVICPHGSGETNYTVPSGKTRRHETIRTERK